MEGESSCCPQAGIPLDSNNNNNANDAKSSCLNIVYYNARSLHPKMDELRAFVDIHQPHIICIVETWLCEDISDNEIGLHGYQVLRLDRNRHGGGLLMYVHESLVPKVIVVGPSDIELLIISVTGHASTCKHHVGLYYPPPSSGVENIQPSESRCILFF